MPDGYMYMYVRQLVHVHGRPLVHQRTCGDNQL